MPSPDPTTAWLKRNHEQTWIQLVRNHQIPAFLTETLDGTSRHDDVSMARALSSAYTRWPTMEQYLLAVECHGCKAPTGTPCTIERGTHSAHTTRQSSAIRLRNHDIGTAPDAEDRQPGRIYSDIT